HPVPPPSTLTPVPLALEQVVLRALAKAPDERFESAAQMLAAFEAACQASPQWRPRGGRAAQPSPRVAGARAAAVTPVSVTPRLRPARGMWWVLALVAGAGLGVVVVKMRQQRHT